MSLQRRFPYAFLVLWLGLIAAGCSMVEVRTEGQGQALRWHATDIRQYTVAIKHQEVYEYTLVLEELRGTTVTFTTLQARFRNNLHSRPSDWKKAGQWVLPAGGQLRIPMGTYRHCHAGHCRDWGPLAPVWHLVLTGTDEQGQPVREVIEMSLPTVTATS